MGPILPLNEDIVIVNVVSGRLLDADLETINSDGTTTQLFGRDALNQRQRQWRLLSAGGDCYNIVSVHSSRFLDADTQTIQSDGTKVQLFGTEIPTMPNRQWRFVGTSGNRFFIVNQQSGRLLDADSATLGVDGTKVQLYGFDGENMPNRQWQVMRVDEYQAAKPPAHCFQDAPRHFDLLIISPYAFANLFGAFRAAKRNHGIESHLLLLTATSDGHEGVLNDFPGADHPERIKRAIDYARGVHNARYMMLVGDASVFPCRCRFTREADDVSQGAFAGWHDGTYNPSDLYYANLYHHDSASHPFDTWDQNANNKYNEQQWGANVAISYNPDNVDGFPDVAVGRIPAHDANEVQIYLQKVISYEASSPTANGRKAFGFAADRNYAGGDQMSDQVRQAISPGVASSVSLVLFNASQSDPVLPGWSRAQDSALSDLARTCWWLSYVGHGSSAGWDFADADFARIQKLTNAPNFPVVFAAACETGRYLGNAPIGPYQDNAGRFRWFFYHKDDQPPVSPDRQIDERDENGNVLRYSRKPLIVPTPSPYDFSDTRNRTVACAWLFNPNGGAIAYFGEVVVCEDDKGRDMEIAVLSQFAKSGSPPKTLGDLWLAAQQKYWYDNHLNAEVFRAPRIYLGIMAFFGDPSLRLA